MAQNGTIVYFNYTCIFICNDLQNIKARIQMLIDIVNKNCSSHLDMKPLIIFRN